MSPTTEAPAPSSNLRTRILSAIVLAPIALGLAWVGGWPFAGLIAAASVAMAVELAALLPGHSPAERLLLGGFALMAVAVAAAGLPAVALIAGVAGLCFSLAIRMWRGEALWVPVFAFPYLVLPLVAILWLRLDPLLGRAAIFWLLGIVWATDTCAYFAGRTIGGPKIAPSLSPKKTWAGLVGGMLGAGAVGFGTSLWLGMGSPAMLGGLSMLLAVVAQAGDFLESGLKRRAGVKDSGKLIPGHGGILDRVDGLVAAAVGAGLLALFHGATSPGAGVLIWP
jgi:phosphatidate cytidylyltransferase